MKSNRVKYSIILGVTAAVCAVVVGVTVAFYTMDRFRGIIGWKESPKVTEGDVKVYTLDGDSVVENDTSQYELKPYFYGFFVEFKEGARCVELKLKDKTMWLFDSNKNIRPTKTYFDKTLSLAFVEFKDHLFSVYAFSDDEVALVSEQTINALPSSQFKLMTTDKSGINIDLPTDKYDLLDYGYIFEFKMKNGGQCSELKHNNNTVWQRDTHQVGAEYPSRISVSKFNQFVFIYFTRSYLSFKFEDGKWKVVIRTLVKLDDSKFKLKTVKADGTDESDDTSRFSKRGSKRTFTLKSKDGFRFSQVSYDGTTIWAKSRTPQKDYPTKIALKLEENCVWVHFALTNFNVYKFVNDRWKLVFSPETGRR